MKEMRRIIALVLTLVMVIGMVPVSAFAAETVLDAAIFCSDVHGSSSDLTSVLGGVAKSGVDYSSIGFVGDTCLTVANTTSIVQSALSDTDIDVMFSYASSHDTEDGADIDDDWDYSGEVEGVSEHYLVYTIRETDMQNSSGASTAAPAFTTWYNGLTAAQKALPIFIMSHRPMHDRRDDNAGAATWYTAISAAAKTSDIVFFWGHNHTGDNEVDQAAYYVAKDGTESFTVYNGSTVVPNFTYMNAGYINANNQNPARLGVATTVQITADSLIFQDYNSSGAYSGTYAHNVTVEREFAAEEVTLSSIAVSGKTEYYVGDKLDLTVTATYSDGATADVTADSTLSGYDMSTAGTQTVTATYGEKTATIGITVTAVQLNSIAVTTQPTKLTYVTGESLDTTGMVVTGTYNNGTTAEITGWYTSAVDMTTAGEKTVTVYYAVDSITYQTSFTIKVEQGVAEGVVLESIEITEAPDKTEYLISQSLDLDGMVVVATFSDGSTAELEYKPFSTSTIYGGYELYNFSMYVEKAHELAVVYTFGDVTCYDTTTINVWDEDFEDENTGVKVLVADEDYGVTAVQVSPSSNSYVAAAVKDFIKDGTVVAYDITLTLDADGYALTDGNKTVTLPIPEGVNNPVVYYVSDDGETVTNMNAVKDGNGNVTFTTTHFSTYVIGESTEIEVPENETATGSGTTTTTTKKTVYVLTSSISSGNDYLIVNGNSAGSYYALANNSGSVAATGVTVKTDSEIGTYIELDDATDELWTVSNSYRFQNSGYYLRYNNGLGLSTSNYTTWSYSNNRLSYSSGRDTYYLRYNSGWTTTTRSSSATSIYFYIPTEVEVETTTTVSGTYTIEGEDLTVAVSEGSTANLTSTLTFTPDSGDATTTDTSTTATYEIVTVDAYGNTVNGDPNGIIKSISGNTVTFSGNYGKALVKVSYTTSFGDVTDYITVEAKAPYYTIDITDGTKGETDDDGNTTYPSVTSTIALKGITAGQTYQLYYDLVGHGIEVPEGATVTWSSSNTSVATVGENGLVTLTGTGGSATITVTYQIDEDTAVTDTINLTAATSNWYTSADGGENFPAYPNEGAVRFDKTATAVGNFSETGITQVELSMTGVPYTTDNAMDVVVMLDMTGSMSDDGMEAAEEATKAFVEKIVKNEDGTYNNNRVAVYAFNSGSSSPYELVSLKSITSDSELATANTAIDTASDKQESGGTPFDEAAQKCHDVLEAARADGIGNDRQQFCVFMSDGGPTAYEGSDGYSYYGGNNSSGDRAITSYIGGYTSASSSSWTYNLPTEYWTDHMKEDGVTVYTVGLLLQNAPSSPAPYSSMTDSTYDSTTDSLTTIGSHYYFTSTILKNMASDAGKYIDIFDVDNADNATAKFTAIAQSILEAATDVVVQDKIADAYTMVFDIPTGSKEIEGLDSQEFYIEVKEYALDANHERTTSTSLMKLYLGESNGSYYAASDNSGTAYASPVFGTDPIGTKFYWTTTEDTTSGVSVEVDGTTYYFVAAGKSNTASDFDSSVWFNMTSGAYASGTVDNSTNTSSDLIIATPYFVYNASTRMLAWTAAKLSSAELALSYFLYLDCSATEVGTPNEIDAATYPTNDYAYLTYTNYLGNSCYQEFPEPQMTWNGAQVTYVFYLVNDAGQPVNQYGQVVDFANAVFVTAPVTEAVIWNGTAGVKSLESSIIADEVLPEGYELYDAKATYDIRVFQDSDGKSLFDYFTIGGAASGLESYTTTKVYNTKAGTKYSNYGTYSSVETGTYTYTHPVTGENVTVTVGTKTDDIDYANTTVAFAVTWYAHLVSDTVVVDFGLPVGIEVLANDMVAATLNSVSKTGYGSTYAMNTGVANTGFEKPTNGYITLANGDTVAPYGDTIYYSQKDMQFTEPAVFYYDAEVTYYKDSNKQTGYIYSQVTVIPATTVYYEDSFVDFSVYNKSGNSWNLTDDTWAVDGTTATNVTQAADRPGVGSLNDANNVYGYDKAYDTYSTYSLGSARYVTANDSTYGTATFTFYGTGFDIVSMASSNTGLITVKIYKGAEATGTSVKNLTVDTYYGYTTEYHKLTYTYQVDYSKETFTYTDGQWVLTSTETVSSATELKTGNEPTSASEGDTFIKYWIVADSGKWVLTNDETVAAMGTDTTVEEPAVGDTHVSYEKRWVVDPAVTDSMYQVPVISYEGLAYGQYTVVVKCAYNTALDHQGDGSYNFYLDAIRVYDPTGVVSGATTNSVVSGAYNADGEAYPAYQEIRENIIAASNVTVTKNTDGSLTATLTNGSDTIESLDGAVFIDGSAAETSISDYVSYGPNNELYLAQNQAIAFKVNLTAKTGYEIADVQVGMKSVANGATVTCTVNNNAKTLSTANDMYYSIKDYAVAADGTAAVVTIKNTSSGILSLTNIKVTYKLIEDSGVAAASEDDGLAVASEEEGGISTASLLYTDAEVVTTSLMSLRRAPVEEETDSTEPTEPETEATEPETEATEPETEATEPETEPTEPEEEQKPGKPGKPSKPGNSNKPGNNNKPGNGNKNPVWDRFKNAVEFIFGWLLH